MEYIILIIFLITIYLMLMIIFDIKIKRIKELAEDKELDEIAKKYPENIELCKEYLDILENKEVEIEEDKKSNATLYLIMSNKIFIGNLNNSYTRIQTIAHECLHSMQSKKMLWFNFIFSNMYIIYFILISILIITKLFVFKEIFLSVLFLFGLTFLGVRSYLEVDAMTKARFLAKDYMYQKKISKKEEIDKIIKRYDELNDIGIKYTVLKLMSNVFIKITIFAMLCIIF